MTDFGDFRQELQDLINKYRLIARDAKQNVSDTPDHILAQFVENALVVFDKAVLARDHWERCQ